MVYLITGGAGFIGSNIAEALVRRGEKVRILDDFSSGRKENLTFPGADRIEIVTGDIRDARTCRRAVDGAAHVLHHAALASVPASVADPGRCHDVNVTGTLHLLLASRDAGVRRFVYASSSAVYGDRPGDAGSSAGEEDIPPKNERLLPDPPSPYAASKLAGEHYCRIFCDLYGLPTICFRYFNVFGPRQDPASEYAAVIPKFVQSVLRGKRPVIYGDGLQSRDFIYVEDVVHANLLACSAPAGATGRVFNIAGNRRISLLSLLDAVGRIAGSPVPPVHEPVRPGDILHSWADISRARDCLGFSPAWSLDRGLSATMAWYGQQERNQPACTP